ncbi:MAG TPA: alpha/beta hydrolase [Xanthobacteraceae bacterium]|jgi:lysophospholipase|nr:alpha/beta hydrolase [Xanthobacteraceae bacterium]
MKLVSIPANPVPEDYVTGLIETPDGVELRYAHWAPPPGRKGTVCVFPGRTEFIEKYFEVVRDLRARGFAVAVLDWRGQGFSERALRDTFKGHVGDFAEYDIDLRTFMQEVVLPDCPPPFFALAHSMGASVLIRAAHDGHRWFDRMVLTAPLVRLARAHMFGHAHIVARTLRMTGMGSAYVPRGSAEVMHTRPFVGNNLTSDPVRHARAAAILEAEPKLGIGSPTVGWCDAAFRMMREIAEPAYAAAIRQPILIAAAGRDEIVSTPAIEEFAMNLRAGSHLVIAGAQHEILMEQDQYRLQFWAAFDAFVPGTPLYR